MKRIFPLLILVFLTCSHAWSQETITETESPQDLNTQYSTLKDNAETYGEFKVFRESKLDAFWSDVIDSLTQKNEVVNGKQQIITTQQAEIEKLNTEMKENEQRFEENEYAATHINFLGLGFTKSTFKIVVSIMIVGLSILLLLGYTQFSHNKRVATKNAEACSKLEDELENLRKKSLEKQIRLNRELQTQRNKVEELRNKTSVKKRISA